MRLTQWYGEGFFEGKGDGAVVGLTIAQAKKRLREKGGTAFTVVCDRKGNFMEKIPIVLEDNGGAAEWGEAFEAGKHGGAE